jgi:apolipoprotein N-acyltransferase
MRRVLTALVLIPLAAVAYGWARLSLDSPRAGMLRVGLVQGNVPQDEKWEASARLRILDAHEEATREAAGQGARLVVWPESSVPLPLTEEPTYRLRLEGLARELGIDLLVGSVHYSRSPEGAGEIRVIHNSAFLIGGDDREADHVRYDKIHLVPFGEYVPLHRWLGPVDKLVLEAGDFTPGDRVVVMRTGPACVAPLVCFEAIFPSLVRRFTREGAQVIVNITNDAFLGDSAGPRQHLALASLRTVESRRWLVRAANTGISAIVDDRGRVVQASRYGEAAVLVADVPLLEGSTIYMSLGEAPIWGCVILAVASLIAPTRRTGGTSWTRNSSDATPP